ncbi:MAG: cbb3-type cytochrome c oxidase N-terminal domain-containing protein [Chitinophagaceae bacterium]
MRNMIKYISALLTVLLLLFVQPVWAAGPPSPSVFSNPLAVSFIALMLVLLIVIGILANIMIGTADVRLKKRKKEQAVAATRVAAMMLLLLLPSFLFAQGGAAPEATKTATNSIAGMDASTFYIMLTVLFLELAVIIVLLLNIKFLLKQEKEKLAEPVTEEEKAVAAKEKANRLSWWDRFNKFRPASQEADLDLGHDYDGIRELNNRLPPWWLYGFYATILFAVIYLWRFHVSHTGPLSKEEYETSVARADARVQEYLKKKGDAVDENTVTLLTGAEDLAAGKAIFTDPSKCPTCHTATGGGNTIGPNLTDDYWIYGGSIKNIFKTIKYGTNKGMRSWKDDLSAKQIAQVASYVKSLRGSNPPGAKAPQGELYVEENAKPAADSTGKKAADTAAQKNK